MAWTPDKRFPVSGVIIARNEEAGIARAVDSLRGICAEVLVVDSGSTDRTREIAREHGARIVERPFTDFVDQKNFAARSATRDWVLFLDADEALDPSARQVLEEVDWSRTDRVYRFPRRSHYLGSWIDRTRWARETVTRLFHRDSARFEGDAVHEHVVGGSASPVLLPLVVRHWPYRDLEHHLEKINRYSTLAARNRERGRASRLRLLVSPPWRFFRMYVLEGGFRMGTRGWVLAAMASISVFSKYAKRWERDSVPPDSGP